MQPNPMYLVCTNCCYRNVVIPDMYKLQSGQLDICPMCGAALKHEAVRASYVAEVIALIKRSFIGWP